MSAGLNHRTLGAIAMAASPMLLIEFLLAKTGHLPGGEFGSADAALGLVYLAGFFAALVGLRRLRATGESGWAAVCFGVQMALLSAAALEQLLELARVGTGSAFFGLADAAWPLIHLSLSITGLFVLLAGRWKGNRVYPLFLCGLALPALVVLQLAAGRDAGRLAFALLTTVGFGLLGYALRSSFQAGAPAPESGRSPHGSTGRPVRAAISDAKQMR